MKMTREEATSRVLQLLLTACPEAEEKDGELAHPEVALLTIEDALGNLEEARDIIEEYWP